MILVSANETGPSLILIEAGLTVLSIAIALALPRLGSSLFAPLVRAFHRLARRKHLSVASVGAAALLLRLAILPICPIPLPFVQDDFSFLLAADTFASGHLANPTPAMWTHFESVQITMQPTYMSMYFPAQGLILAAGKLLFGHPHGHFWFALLLVNALMCAALCWMLQAWLPPAWALLGGLLAILRISLFSYWINTYSGAGSVACLGAALVLGALPRITRRGARPLDCLLLAAGIAILGLSRPFEGLLLCLPVLFVLIRWILSGRNRPPGATLLRRSLVPIALIVAAVAWLGYYDARAFGNPLTLPYSADREAYAVAPYWIWQSPRPEPVYRHTMMRDFYVGVELTYSNRLHTVSGFLTEALLFKPLRALLFFSGVLFLPLLVMSRRVLLDRRIRFLVVCTALVVGGVSLETWLIPHYWAAITPALYAIGLQAMRHLRQVRLTGQPAGAAILRFSLLSCLVLAGIRLCAEPLHLTLAPWPSAAWASEWYGPGRLGLPRAEVERNLESMPGKQLAIVRYTPVHSPIDEWVYNAADIDGSRVIWAREMDAASNRELLRYYSDRKAWLVEPDAAPPRVTPYPAN
jgi:hypothetical protein